MLLMPNCSSARALTTALLCLHAMLGGMWKPTMLNISVTMGLLMLMVSMVSAVHTRIVLDDGHFYLEDACGGGGGLTYIS